MRKFKVTLEQQERDSLVAITQKGNHQSRKVLNALILLNCDQGQFQDRCLRNEDVAAVLKISLRKIDRVKKRFVEEGLDVALHGRKGQRVYEKKATAISRLTSWRSVAASRRKGFHNGRYGCSPTAWWSSTTSTASPTRRSGEF